MKKSKFFVFICILLVVVSITSIAVFAKKMHSDWVEKKINNGWSERETYYITGIMVLSGENVSAFVEQKYEELGNWIDVAEYYNVDLEKLYHFVENQEQAAKYLEIPDELYKEMKNAGMSDKECKDLARAAHNTEIDLETAWNGVQHGKTVNEIKREQIELKNAQIRIAIDFVCGKINKNEYIEKMKIISQEMTESDIIAFAEDERKQLEKTSKDSTGITDEEIALAKRMGMTNLLEICELKEAEKWSKKTFNEMLEQIVNGDTLEKVVKENISQSKMEASKNENTLASVNDEVE